jgi:hypothetical protein
LKKAEPAIKLQTGFSFGLKAVDIILNKNNILREREREREREQ